MRGACFTARFVGRAAPEPQLPGSRDLSPILVPLLGAELQAPSVPQKNPAKVDYEDLFLYYNALAEEATSSAPGPSERENQSCYPVAADKEVCERKLVPPTWGRVQSTGGQQLPEETF